MVSRYVTDMNGYRVDIKSGGSEAYNQAREFQGNMNKCVVADIKGRSVVFMFNGREQVDNNGTHWSQMDAIAELPVHENGKPFYASGTVFDVKPVYVELYYEEHLSDFTRARGDTEIKKLFIPDIADATKATRDALERSVRRRAWPSMEEGRSVDRQTYCEIRILSDDMTAMDRQYCEDIINSHVGCTIYANDADARKWHVSDAEKREIEAGASGGYPRLPYFDTLVRAREKFIEKGIDTSEIDKKIEDRKVFEEKDPEFIKSEQVNELIEKLEAMRNPKIEDVDTSDIVNESDEKSFDDR